MKTAIRFLQLMTVQNKTLIPSKEQDIGTVSLQHLGRKKEDSTDRKRAEGSPLAKTIMPKF